MDNSKPSIKSVKSTYTHFSELVKELEDAAKAFEGRGGSLESRTSALISSLRKVELRFLLSDFELYERFFSKGNSEKAGEVLERFGVYSCTLNLAIAKAYAALPPEAKASLQDRTLFESMVERKPEYLANLRELTLPS